MQVIWGFVMLVCAVIGWIDKPIQWPIWMIMIGVALRLLGGKDA